MPRHFERRELPYTPEKVFDLVADIERYPEFLPWCRSAHIVSKKGNVVRARLEVGTRTFKDTFDSQVTLARPESISVAYVGGPLQHLTNEWTFEPDDAKGCALSFFVDFSFRSKLLSSMMNLVFEKAFVTMASAFEARARALYGSCKESADANMS